MNIIKSSAHATHKNGFVDLTLDLGTGAILNLTLSLQDAEGLIETIVLEMRSAERLLKSARKAARDRQRAVNRIVGICTRTPHAHKGPCNGFPRADCPGYAEWQRTGKTM